MRKLTLREAIATVRQTIAAQKDNAPQDAQDGVDSMGSSDPEEHELYGTDDAELEDTGETPCEAGSWRVRGSELQVVDGGGGDGAVAVAGGNDACQLIDPLQQMPAKQTAVVVQMGRADQILLLSHRVGNFLHRSHKGHPFCVYRIIITERRRFDNGL